MRTTSGRRLGGSLDGEWKVAIAAAFLLGTSIGVGAYVQPILVEPLTRTGNISAMDVASASSVQALSNALACPVMIILCRRVPPWKVAFVSGIGCAVAVLLLPFVHSAWQLDAVLLLFGVALAGCGFALIGTFVAKFLRNPVRVLAVAFTGASMGGAILAPATEWIIGLTGLDIAVYFLAVGFLVLVCANSLLFLRVNNGQAGITDGGREGANRAGPKFHDAVRTVRFWALLVGATLQSFAQLAAQIHALPIAREHGITAASLSITVMALTAAVSRAFSGLLLRLLSTVQLACVLCLIQAGAIVLLGTGYSAPTFLVGSALLGVAVGNNPLVVSILIPELFGTRDLERISAGIQLCIGVGTAMGPAVLGIVRDSTGGYRISMLIFGVVCLLATILLKQLDAIAGRHRRPYGRRGRHARPARFRRKPGLTIPAKALSSEAPSAEYPSMAGGLR